MSQPLFPIIDLHSDYVMACYEKGDEYHTKDQTSLSQLKDNNVRLIFSGFSYDDEFKDSDRQLSILQEQYKNNNFYPVRSFLDISQVTHDSSYPVGMLLHIEGSKVLGQNMDKLHEYYRQGVRSIGFTHNHGNQFATGCKDGNSTGFTELGKQLIKEASSMRMVLDASHLNEKSFYDLLNLSSYPVIVTHGNTFEHCPNPRNFTDSQIKDLSSQGGVIGVFFSASYVNADPAKASLEDIVEHCLHIVEVGGINCLAIGSDFGGITTGLPTGLENVSKLPSLFSALHMAGFTDVDLEKVAFRNVLSVMEKVLAQ